MRYCLQIFLIISIYAVSTAVSQKITTEDPCCIDCSCLAPADCDACIYCVFTVSGCRQDTSNTPFECCLECDCVSPGECMSCNCCVNWETEECFKPPCDTTSTTQTTLPRPKRTTTTTSTTFFDHPSAHQLITTSTTSTTSKPATSTTTIPTTTSTSTTSTTMLKPNCADGIMNQAEEWIDCGGPCEPCSVPDVRVSIDNPANVDKGSDFEVKVKLKSNQSGTYNVDVRLPEGFESRVRNNRDLKVESDKEEALDLIVQASGDLKDQEYPIEVNVRDNRRIRAAKARSVVKVDEPILLKTPLAHVRLPSVRELRRRFKEVSGKVFKIVDNTISVVYSSRWLWLALTLMLFCLTYMYYVWRRGTGW